MDKNIGSFEEGAITSQDVIKINSGNAFFKYDAYILYADNEEDEEFAFEIKNKMESEYLFKFCTKNDFLLGVSFEHDAIMRLLQEHRCDKLIVIVSKRFPEDKLSCYITKYAQALQISDQRNIIPCSKQYCDVIYNLKGLSILCMARAGKLFDFWSRLKKSLEESRVEICPHDVLNFSFENLSLRPVNNKKSDESKGIVSKVRKMYSSAKKRVKIKN